MSTTANSVAFARLALWNIVEERSPSSKRAGLALLVLYVLGSGRLVHMALNSPYEEWRGLLLASLLGMLCFLFLCFLLIGLCLTDWHFNRNRIEKIAQIHDITIR